MAFFPYINKFQNILKSISALVFVHMTAKAAGGGLETIHISWGRIVEEFGRKYVSATNLLLRKISLDINPFQI